MKKPIASMVCAVALNLAVVGAATADYVVGHYTGRCDYKCCDQNFNCAIFYFYQGSGDGAALPIACSWEAVCSKEGDIGWSYGGTPTEKNSEVTLTKGCWVAWRKGTRNDWPPGDLYTKPCTTEESENQQPK